MYTSENILQVAKCLVAKENFNQETLANTYTLGITQKENESLQGYDTLVYAVLCLC